MKPVWQQDQDKLLDQALDKLEALAASQPVPPPDNRPALQQMVEQAKDAPAVTLWLLVIPTGGGHYSVEACEPTRTVDLPAKFSFLSDNADEIIVWSTNAFLRRDQAHEIAIREGEKRGLYV